MPRFELLEELMEAFKIPGNRFFKVKKSVPFWWISGHRETNFSMGASRVSQAVFTKTALKPGDEIHALVGGVFAIRKNGGQPVTGVLKAPDPERTPFDRDTGRRSTDGIEALVKSEKLEEIPREEAIKGNYRQNREPPKKF